MIKSSYTATPFACGWAEPVLEKVTSKYGGAVGSKISKTPKKYQVAQGQYMVSDTRCSALRDCGMRGSRAVALKGT